MKELFVNNTGKFLIEDKYFSIVDTSSMPAIITKYTFIKNKWGYLNIINFIDADIINFDYIDTIRNLCTDELKIFKSNFHSKRYIYYKVFVSSDGLSSDIVEKILSLYNSSKLKKSCFIPVILDLSTEKVTANFSKDTAGLKELLDRSIKNMEHYNVIYDLQEVQKNAENEIKLNTANSTESHFKPYITYLIILANVIIFILMTLAGGTENINVLIKYGAKINSLILEGQYWRLLSSAFIHIGIAHIIFNMYGLYNMGTLVEKIYGHSKYLFVYLTAALCGSISSFIFSTALSAGASGAIFGLFGALLYFGQRRPRIFSTSFGINVLIVLGFNLIYGFTNTGIDNFAHIGGLIGGYLAANITGIASEKKMNYKKLAALVLTFILITLGIFLGINKNNSSWEYNCQVGINSYIDGDMVKSREHLEKAIAQNPDSEQAHAFLSLVYYNTGDEIRGREEFDKAVNINDDQPDLYFNLGNFFYSNKRYAEAEDMFERFVRIRPGLYEGYLNLGVSQNMQGKLDQAEINLKKAVEIAPDDFLANSNLGYTYLEKGDISSAKTYLEKAQKINPDDKNTKDTLEYINSKLQN